MGGGTIHKQSGLNEKRNKNGNKFANKVQTGHKNKKGGACNKAQIGTKVTAGEPIGKLKFDIRSGMAN